MAWAVFTPVISSMKVGSNWAKRWDKAARLTNGKSSKKVSIAHVTDYKDSVCKCQTKLVKKDRRNLASFNMTNFLITLDFRLTKMAISGIMGSFNSQKHTGKGLWEE